MSEALASSVLQTLTEPRAAARQVLRWNMAVPDIATLIAAASVLGLLGAAISASLDGDGLILVFRSPDGEEVLRLPILSVPVIAFMLGQIFVPTALAAWIGRLFGGSASLWQMLQAVGWVSLVQGIAGLAVLVVLRVLPAPIATFLVVGINLWFIWILFSFVAEVHGFPSTGRVMMVGIGCAIVIALLLGMVLVSAGFTLPEAA